MSVAETIAFATSKHEFRHAISEPGYSRIFESSHGAERRPVIVPLAGAVQAALTLLNRHHRTLAWPHTRAVSDPAPNLWAALLVAFALAVSAPS